MILVGRKWVDCQPGKLICNGRLDFYNLVPEEFCHDLAKSGALLWLSCRCGAVRVCVQYVLDRSPLLLGIGGLVDTFFDEPAAAVCNDAIRRST